MELAKDCQELAKHLRTIDPLVKLTGDGPLELTTTSIDISLKLQRLLGDWASCEKNNAASLNLSAEALELIAAVLQDSDLEAAKTFLIEHNARVRALTVDSLSRQPPQDAARKTRP